MGREGEGSNKLTSNRVEVINERLIREGIYLAPTVKGDDDRSGLKGQDTAFGVATGEKAEAQQRRAQAQSMELHRVTVLMLSFRNIGTIDNLVGVQNLTKLMLDNNHITVIQNLSHLKKLKWLDLSFNRITMIEGLDELTELEDLSLYSNQIKFLQNMEKLQKLTCLSLGKNDIQQDIDTVARYLHQFRHLRMLTLQGNSKIDSVATYKIRLIGHIDHIKFLDNRLILEEDIAKAKEEQQEQLAPITQADAKAEADRAAEQAREEEDADYERANCPNDQHLFDELMRMRTTGNIYALLSEVDFVREKVKEIMDEQRTAFTAAAKEMADQMKELRKKKDREDADFHRTLDDAKSRTNSRCKKLISEFEKALKKVIPFGLRAATGVTTDGSTALDEGVIEQLNADLAELRSQLLEEEADQLDAYDSVITQYEIRLKDHRTEAAEIMNRGFEEMQNVIKRLPNSLREKLDQMHNDRQLQLTDTSEGGATVYDAAASGNPEAAQLLMMLDSKEEYSKALTDWSDLHVERLNTLQSKHDKTEDARVVDLHKAAVAEEHKRNRSRVGEIHAYIARMSEYIAQFERSFDAYSP